MEYESAGFEKTDGIIEKSADENHGRGSHHVQRPAARHRRPGRAAGVEYGVGRRHHHPAGPSLNGSGETPCPAGGGGW